MKKALIFLGSAVLVVFPLSGFAADGFVGSIVPDVFSSGNTGPYLQACDLVELFDRLIRFAVYFSAVVATLMFAYAGFLYVTAEAKADNKTQAKKIFGDVLTGFVFILGAWLIINIIMSIFVEEKTYPWNEIKCASYAEVPTYTPEEELGIIERGCADCTTISPEIPTKGGIGGQVDRDLNEELKKLEMDEYGMRVTEAYPPTTYGHQNACHYNGTCVDAGWEKTEDRTAANITKALRSAEGTDVRMVYEVPTAERRTELLEQGIPPANVTVVSGINAEHFSIYCGSCDD